MKIGIIIEPYEEKNASGIALCILEQTQNLLKIDKENEYLIYTSKPFKKERIFRNAKNVLVPKSFFGKNLWFLKNFFFNRSMVPDILIFNMPLLPLLLGKKIKTIPVFYEVVDGFVFSLKDKILNIFRNYLTKISLKRAAFIVTPSKASKDDLLKHYNIKDQKIKVIYLGFQDLSEFKESAVEVDDKNIPYFLFVGKVKFKKNVHGIVDGFIKFKKSTGASHKLVLVGDYGGEYYEKILKSLRESNLESEVVFKGYIYDQNLYAFYKGATALVFCTLREGFGMPLVEAMNLGVPVITSNISSMPEVVADAAILVDPYNTNDIADAMGKAAFDNNLREDLIKKGFERAKQFSWQKHASQIQELIYKITD